MARKNTTVSSSDIPFLTASQKKSKSTAATNKTASVGTEAQDWCDYVGEAINNHLAELCSDRQNRLKSCDDEDGACPCGTGGADKVDLILLIDTSSSMGATASAISAAAESAIAAAAKTCPTDLRIEYFGVEGVWSGTKFTQNHRVYLDGITTAVTFEGDKTPRTYASEQGANAISDLSNHYDWRDNSCRAIFYVSDTILDGYDGFPPDQGANDDAATAQAILDANSNSVTVFAHYLKSSTWSNDVPATAQNYRDLCEKTGGKAIIGGVATTKRYTKLLSEIICKACGGCKEADLPDYQPCISVSWGEAGCETLDTDDSVVLCITVCNCYSNITFSDFVLKYAFIYDDKDALPPNLPDGTPSVHVKPLGPICFGDIPPCSDENPGCVSRELVLLSRGAKPGDYKLKLATCFNVKIESRHESCFVVNLCKD